MMGLFQLLSSQDVNWWTGVVWIIVMFLSAVWSLILTAPIHCKQIFIFGWTLAFKSSGLRNSCTSSSSLSRFLPSDVGGPGVCWRKRDLGLQWFRIPCGRAERSLGGDGQRRDLSARRRRHGRERLWRSGELPQRSCRVWGLFPHSVRRDAERWRDIRMSLGGNKTHLLRVTTSVE